MAAAQPIVLVPLCLRAWGADEYGRWLVLTALVSYLSMLDLGGQSYIGNLLALNHANGKRDSFRQILSEGVSLFILIAAAGLVLLLGLLFGLMNPRVTGMGSALANSERLIILFLGSGFLLSVPTGVYLSVYRARGLFVRGTMLGNVFRLAHLVLSVGMLTTSTSPLVYAFVLLVANVTSTLVIVRDSRRTIAGCGEIRLSLAAAKRGQQYLRGALQFWLLALANGLNQQGVLLVLGIFASPAIVAVYATHRTAAGLVGYVGALLQAPLWPEFSKLSAQGRREDLRHVALSAIKVVMLVSGLAAVAMWVVLPSIYPLWTNKQLQLKPALFAVFLLQGVLAAGWFTSAWSLFATNEHRMPARWSLANAVVTIALTLVLGPKYGVMGVALATLIGDVLCGLAVYPRLAARILGLSAWSVYQAMMLVVLLLLPLLMAVIIARHWLTGWLFVASFLVVGAAGCMLAVPRGIAAQAWLNGLLRRSHEGASR